jgi:CheY-like chemotaxis protein
VLVAEDNEVNQIVVNEILTKAGIGCEIVSDGRSALEAIERTHFDLVLMDCQMPVIDGFEATREIRRREATRAVNGKKVERLPIIALTANAMKGDRERCLEAGMDGYTMKPINPQNLLRSIETMIGSRLGQSSSERTAA